MAAIARSPLQLYQREFVEFLLASNALTFGDFVTKSGRKTPYFINTGRFDDGRKIAELGRFYAAHIVQHGLDRSDIIFGPAYKGIPLAVTTAAALHQHHGRNIGFAFDRKEPKEHGDGGLLVGHPIAPGARVVIVEDVITAGTTLRHIVPLLERLAPGVTIPGVVLAVDRCERGTGELSAVQEASRSSGLSIYPIVTIHDIVAHLREMPGSPLTATLSARIDAYLSEYGVQQ